MARYYYRNANAPDASSIHVGTVVAVRYEKRVLLDLRRDGMWGLVGGALEIGESLEDCARREVVEETGLDIGPLRLIGSFSDPTRIIERPDRSVQSVTICFDAECKNNELRLSDESREARFFSSDELASLDVVATHSIIVPYLFAPKMWPVIA